MLLILPENCQTTCHTPTKDRSAPRNRTPRRWRSELRTGAQVPESIWPTFDTFVSPRLSEISVLYRAL